MNEVITDEAGKVEISQSQHFKTWLAEQQASLFFTTYQAGKLFMLGLQNDGRLSIFERTFNRCMGLYATSDTLYMSTLYQLWRFDNAIPTGQLHEGYDRVYIPRLAHTTGDIDIHDVFVGKNGQVVFVNTLFSCLSTISATTSFKPLWAPPFISTLAAEDRCHLNGLAMDQGVPRYVTAVAQTDTNEGWRDFRQEGGIVMDVQSNEIVASNLSMPHSPRVYQGKLWLLNAGTGYFGFIDFKSGHFEPVAFCPGYLRGLTFIGKFAIVGLSKPRHNQTFTGLSLNEELDKGSSKAYCGLQVIDIESGEVVHSLNLDGVVDELYDVVVVPGVVRPKALGLKSDEICRFITVDGLETFNDGLRKKSFDNN